MKGLVIADRDGTLVEPAEGKYLNNVKDMVIIPGVLESIVKLQKADFAVGVVTNQAGIGLGHVPEFNVREIHIIFNNELEKAGGQRLVHHICAHRKYEHCGCRKPEPGMLYAQMGYHKFFDREKIVMVGDYYTDILAGSRVHPELTTILVETGRGKAPENEPLFRYFGIWPTYTCVDFNEAAEFIIGEFS